MSIKSSLAKVYAFIVKKKINHWSSRPHQTQQKVFKNLLTKGAHTVFGKDHQFDKITTYEEFVNRVPVRDYEGLRSYVDRVVAGGKKTFYGQENRCILLKLQEPHRGQNIFLLQQSLCPLILLPPKTQSCVI